MDFFRSYTKTAIILSVQSEKHHVPAPVKKKTTYNMFIIPHVKALTRNKKACKGDFYFYFFWLVF